MDEERPPPVRNVSLRRLEAGTGASREDVVAVEHRLDLVLDGRRLVSLSCLPTELEALALGFLYGESIVRNPAAVTVRVSPDGTEAQVAGDLDQEAIDAFGEHATLTTGCGAALSAQDAERMGRCRRIDTVLRVEAATVTALVRSLHDRAAIFQATGGTHVAALAGTDGSLLYSAEDVGRHNAIDKVIGRALLSGRSTADLLLASSGRVSAEILLKAARARLPVVVSRSAPTSKAVDLAEDFLVTLVGFVRGKRMNVYTVPERII